jgi:hypothetical protein
MASVPLSSDTLLRLKAVFPPRVINDNYFCRSNDN